MKLVNQKAENRSASKFFYKWREAYLNSLKKFDHKLESVKMVLARHKRNDHYELRRALAFWKDRVNKQ